MSRENCDLKVWVLQVYRHEPIWMSTGGAPRGQTLLTHLCWVPRGEAEQRLPCWEALHPNLVTEGLKHLPYSESPQWNWTVTVGEAAMGKTGFGTSEACRWLRRNMCLIASVCFLPAKRSPRQCRQRGQLGRWEHQESTPS